MISAISYVKAGDLKRCVQNGAERCDSLIGEPIKPRPTTLNLAPVLFFTSSCWHFYSHTEQHRLKSYTLPCNI